MKKTLNRKKKLRYGSVSVALIVTVIAVAVLANAVFDKLADRFSWVTSLRGERTFEVSETCFDLLGNVIGAQADGKTAEIIFCDTEEVILGDSWMDYVYSTAKSIAARFPENVKVSCHDIWTDPDSVRPYLVSLNPQTGFIEEIPVDSDSVIVVSGSYHRVYSKPDFFSFSSADDSIPWGYNGEKKLASAILRALAPETPTVCLTNNHGEKFYDYELVYLLDDAGYNIYYMDLYNDVIPDDCDLIVSFNPATDLVDDGVSAVSEMDILEEFLAEGGNGFLVFFGNGTPSLPNYEAFLKGWGVETMYHKNVTTGNSYRYMVQDSNESLTSDGYTIRAAAADGTMPTDAVIFKGATALRGAEGADGFARNADGTYQKGNRLMRPLYRSGDGTLCYANGSAVASGSAILMTMTHQTNADGISSVAVVASSDFGYESFLQSAVYGNSDAICTVLAEMGDNVVPLGLRLLPFSTTDISTVTTAQMVKWTVLLTSVPVVAVTLIAVVYLVRRRRA